MSYLTHQSVPTPNSSYFITLHVPPPGIGLGVGVVVTVGVIVGVILIDGVTVGVILILGVIDGLTLGEGTGASQGNSVLQKSLVSVTLIIAAGAAPYEPPWVADQP